VLCPETPCKSLAFASYPCYPNLTVQVRAAGQYLDDRVMVFDRPIFVSVPFGVKRNIVSVTFLGFNVVTPRCAVPYPGGASCKPTRGPGRRLGDTAGGSDECIVFEKELFRKEKPIVSIDSFIMCVVVPINYFFFAGMLTTVSLKGSLCLADQSGRFVGQGLLGSGGDSLLAVVVPPSPACRSWL
jgi:hypothetical protein